MMSMTQKTAPKQKKLSNQIKSSMPSSHLQKVKALENLQ